MKTVIIKYNAGNIRSVSYALERLGQTALVSDDPEVIQSADKVIFPGVGEASSAMQYLETHGLTDLIRNLQQPFLGICLGLQLMCRHSEEGDVDCLGIFDENVLDFSGFKNKENSELKIPQIGWNRICNLKTPLFKGVKEGSYCYFVHGYYVSKGNNTIAETPYFVPYSAALHKNNFYGVQFHPEKSAEVGERIIRNFLEL